MAEPAGLAVGVTSLALQLGESAVKLRRLYKSYKGAPEALADTAEELETFQLLLERIGSEGMKLDAGDPLLLDKSIQICHRSSKRIDTVVNKMEMTMQKSCRWGRVRIVAAEGQINQLCMNIHRAITTLHFAFDLYTE